MQFGDIFDENVDYYNWESNNSNIPEIKTDESIIISLYKHKGDYSEDPILVNEMKPLLEHPRITFITFDFTFDFDKLYNYGINIKTNRIIDIQLSKLPDDSVLNETKDFICSTGWRRLDEFIFQTNEDNVNANLIFRAKESVKSGKKKFPHEENYFLCKQFNYPSICNFTNIFLEYSAGDIFYTAIAGVDILTRGEFEEVKERTQDKFKSYQEYRNKYGCVSIVRQAYYVRESFSSAIQVQFSKENETYQILSYFKKLNSFISLIDRYPQLLKIVIPSFNDDDASIIRQKYKDIIDIMKDTESVHLGNIKDKAILSYVHGIPKVPAFVLRFNEEVDQVQEEIKQENIAIKEKEEKEKEAVDQITGGRKNLFKVNSDISAWKNLNLPETSKPSNNITKKSIKQTKFDITSSSNNKTIIQKEEKEVKLKKTTNSHWSNLNLPNSCISINDTDKFQSTHLNHNNKTMDHGRGRNDNNKSDKKEMKKSMRYDKTHQSTHIDTNSNIKVSRSSYNSEKPVSKAWTIFSQSQRNDENNFVHNHHENISNNDQKPQPEVPKLVIKPVNQAWTTFSQSQSNQSTKKAVTLAEVNIPQRAKPPINIPSSKTEINQQQIISDFKPKQSHSSSIDTNKSHIGKSYLF